jgi:hypothetical protein
MAEVLVEFSEPVLDKDGITYTARACGAETANGHWQGWVEFVPMNGGDVVRSGRETTQPNRIDTVYWATGLTPVYLEGALERALKPLVLPPARPIGPPAYHEPAPHPVRPPPAESILNPFSVYRKGEGLLRRQLGALSERHLVNIIRAHDLSELSLAELNAMNAAELVELIVTAVRMTSGEPAVR